MGVSQGSFSLRVCNDDFYSGEDLQQQTARTQINKKSPGSSSITHYVAVFQFLVLN